MIEIERLTKTYGTKVALTIDAWTLPSGNCVLSGENGAGKTTLLMILAGLEQPTRGVVRIAGHPAGSPGARAVVTFAPDQPALFDDLTLADQMTYVSRLHGKDAPFHVAQTLAERLGSEDLLERFPRGMSKGQRQSAGLLVAMSRPFEVLLLDEPTTGLDERSRRGLIDLLGELGSDGFTILSSTHDTDLLREADRSVTVAGGAVSPASAP